MRISAYGTIILAAWNILKVFLYLIMDKGFFESVVAEYDFSPLMIKMIIFICFMVFLVDLILRLIVSKAAIKDSKGCKKGIGYIVFGIVIIICIYIPMIVSDIRIIFTDIDNSLLIDQIISSLVDLTSVYAMVDLIYCSIRFKILTKQKGDGELYAG